MIAQEVSEKNKRTSKTKKTTPPEPIAWLNRSIPSPLEPVTDLFTTVDA